MKKRIGLLVLLLGMFCLAAACGETADSRAAQALKLEGFESLGPVSVWGDTAACVARRDALMYLCVLEQKEGDWRLTLSNPNALLQDRPAPSLTLDSDLALYWQYAQGDMLFSFDAFREADGSWGQVSETASEPLGNRRRVSLICWRADNGGELAVSTCVEDENEKLLYEEEELFLPAPWLKDAMSLENFDLRRFPAMGSLLDDYFGWPGQAFFAEAAGHLMPGYEFIKGVLRGGEMHFLVRGSDGQKRYVVCDTGFNPHEVSLIESSPLPEDAVLGVENFTDCLGWAPDKLVAIRNIPRSPACGLDFSWGKGAEGMLRFGPDCVIGGEEVYVGQHPWMYLDRMDWQSVPSTLKEALSHVDAGSLNLCYAAVNNPNPADRLHLREKPDRGSPSLGKYYNGTPVRVYEIRGDWAQVEIGQRRGWMMKRYLRMGERGRALPCDTGAMPRLVMRGDTLKLYPDPSNPAFSDRTLHELPLMKVIGLIGEEWYHLWFPLTGEFAFVRQADLWEGNG